MHPRFQSIARQVISWYRANARDLPWRKIADPYAIWISEVMLQQTQVKTVIPYWERWMRLFPNVRTLSTATEERVLRAWEGLGYYSRARNLQRAARQICSEHGGAFPRSYEHVLALPGIGRYTAGAICSIAFAQSAPILDGNVARVLTRLFAIAGSPKERETQSKLWNLSGSIVTATPDPSALNQGLMELGATVCLPRGPLCSICPLSRRCKARAQDRVEQFPTRPEKIEMRERQFVALIIRRRNSVLVRKRAATVINGSLWEFPNFELVSDEKATDIPKRFGLELEPAMTIKHTITRNRITLRAFIGRANGNSKHLARGLASQWCPVAELEKLPFSSAHAKLRVLVQETHQILNNGVA